jgi:hypothetical protein
MTIVDSTGEQKSTEIKMTDEQIKHMVYRFLCWRLPDDFMPDGGILFQPEYNVEYNAARGQPPSRREPVGTNLFTAPQAEAMVRYMVEGMPSAASGEQKSSQGTDHAND